MLYFFFGSAIGVLGAMVGIGGGFIIVPVLLFLGFPHEIVVGTSLFVVLLNSISASLSFGRQKLIDWRAATVFAAATIPGAVLGALVTHSLSGRHFQLFFGVLLLLLAIYLFKNPVRKIAVRTADLDLSERRFFVKRDFVSRSGINFVYVYHELWGFLFSVVVGFFSSLFGIGGGIIQVPAMIQLFSFPPHVAIATSQMILVVTSLIGAGTHILLGAIFWEGAIAMGLGVIIGAQFGAKQAQKIEGTVLLRVLAGALFLVGLRLLFSL